MNLTINGVSKNINRASNVEDLVRLFCPHPTNVITELNGAIIVCASRPKTTLKDGDMVELVNFVGGG